MFSYTDVEDSLQHALPEVESKFNDLQLHRLDSDPYYEVDDTTRGAPMSQALNPFQLPGVEDKSVSTLDEERTRFSGECYEYSRPQTDLFFVTPLSSSCERIKVSNFDLAAPLADCDSFSEEHVPPCPPFSEHFAFDPCTLFVEGCPPQQIGTSVVAFLTSHVVASVTKVKPEKYSIRAEVFVAGASCTIKVRVYSQDEKYAVEVQRRSGDAAVLQSTFRLLTAFLEVHCGGVSEPYHTPAPLVVPEPPELELIQDGNQGPSPEVDIAPLLMMATFAGLEAEVALTLATIAKGGRSSAARLLAAPEQVACTLKDLLASGCLNAVYPAARCVSDLAALGEADPILAHSGLLQMMALQAIAELKTAQGLVGTALAQAVADAVQCSAGSMETAVARELQQVLDDAMKDEILKTNATARTYMEQAWAETKPFV